MVKAIDKVGQILSAYLPKAQELYKAQKANNEADKINFKKEVDIVKLNFLTIVENALKEKLEHEPVFNGDITLDILDIPDTIAEEHERAGGGVFSSKVKVLQELIDFVKNEGLEPLVNCWKWSKNQKEYFATLRVTIPKELVQKLVWEKIEKN